METFILDNNIVVVLLHLYKHIAIDKITNVNSERCKQYARETKSRVYYAKFSVLQSIIRNNMFDTMRTQTQLL